MEYRIDELAQRTGTTSRTIRAHQARGLLPPPALRGRTGYYGEEHVRRLELIAELQARGFSLEAIRQTLDAWAQGGDLAHLVGLHHLLTAPYTDERPGVLTAEGLLERFPEVADHPELLQAAVEQGLLEPRQDGSFTVPSPMLIDAGAQLVLAGIPLAEILDLVKALRTDIADIADRFIDLVGRNLFDPVAEGRADAAAAAEALQRLRPIALEVVRPFLAQEMARATHEALAALAARLGGEPAQRGDPA